MVHEQHDREHVQEQNTPKPDLDDVYERYDEAADDGEVAETRIGAGYGDRFDAPVDHASFHDVTRRLRSLWPVGGRRPANCPRPDSRIREDVNDRLTDDPVLETRHIRLNVHRGEVTLIGLVRNARDRARAEACALAVAGVRCVHNRLSIGAL